MNKRKRNGALNRMTCFQCGKDTLLIGRISVKGERCGETFLVRTNGYKCTSCGFQTIDSRQSEQFTRLVSDAYRAAHGFVTGAEIKARRKRLGMSQQQFADYLGIGSASVKRWEVGQIQEKAMDELIRLKTDPEAARQNLRALEEHMPEPIVVYEEDDLIMTMTAGAIQYCESLPMHVEALSVPDDDREGAACIAA